MTDEQKEKIHQMRDKGLSYSKIASELGIFENTIKSYCRRNNLGTVMTKYTNKVKEKCIVCKQCGKQLKHGLRGNPKKFCSEQCRRKWWKANESKINRKAYYTIICARCGKEFESYGNKDRKFCGHSCFVNFKLTLRHNNDTIMT